jgi:excisionase family DNA binding protein
LSDALDTAFSKRVLDALAARIDEAVVRHLHSLLPAAIEQASLSPWFDTKHAAAYLQISENALRLRVRSGLVPAYRDGAGRLRFHRDHLDRAMKAEPPRRARR